MMHLHAVLLALCAGLLPAASHGEDAASPAPPEQSHFLFDLGWDRGLTYRYESHLAEVDPTGLIGDTVLSGRVGASLYLDGGWADGGAVQDDADGWLGAVRRARFYTSGRLERWLTTDYKFEFAVERSHVYLNDFYLRWAPSRFVDSLRIGYFDSPVAFQNIVASNSRVLMETAAPVSAFVPGFRLGVEASGVANDPSLTWLLHLASVGQSQDFGDASDQPLRIGGRLVWRPWGGGSPDADLLHLGISLGYSPPTGGSVRFRARPESFLVDEVVDTGDLDGGSTLLGVEGVWRRGSFAVQSELLATFVDGRGDVGGKDRAVGDPIFYGGYVQANVALTGETRTYDVRSAAFDRLVPASPFGWGKPGSGALELAGRLSWLDLADGAVDGGRLLSFSLGPAWTWNQNVRVLGGWVVGHVSGRPQSGFLEVFQLRLELSF